MAVAAAHSAFRTGPRRLTHAHGVGSNLVIGAPWGEEGVLRGEVTETLTCKETEHSLFGSGFILTDSEAKKGIV